MGNSEPIYDVVVIGSGVCGAVTAWKLACDGTRVLILEAGETGPERVDLVGAFARAAHKDAGSPYRGREGDRMAPGPEARGDYYRLPEAQEAKDALRSTYLWRSGGSTWHFLGNVPRWYHPILPW